APTDGDSASAFSVRTFSRAQRSPVSARKSFGLLTIDFVRLENQGSSNTTCPDASSVDSHWLAVEGAIPTSRARSALLSRLADRSAHARRNLSKSRRLPTCASERTSRSRYVAR